MGFTIINFLGPKNSSWGSESRGGETQPQRDVGRVLDAEPAAGQQDLWPGLALRDLTPKSLSIGARSIGANMLSAGARQRASHTAVPLSNFT